ncbi:MAG: hypothetical protein EOP48_05670 [Sphingobacteriales bacterium]|nr:MAG: hypothetical protein EOP48_05670 [Sphingobacteriales bacterium]
MNNSIYAPENIKGKKTISISTKTFVDNTTASSAFLVAKSRLTNINQWHDFCTIEASRFSLVDDEGRRIASHAQKGHFIRIDIPGPGNHIGEGLDWVQIQSIVEIQQQTQDLEIIVMTVKPCSNPTTSKNDIAHFLSSTASSTFIVARQGSRVQAEVHGRNEIPNLKSGNFLTKLRNAAIGFGIFLGVSIFQWNLLTEGLLSDNKQ